MINYIKKLLDCHVDDGNEIEKSNDDIYVGDIYKFKGYGYIKIINNLGMGVYLCKIYYDDEAIGVFKMISDITIKNNILITKI